MVSELYDIKINMDFNKTDENITFIGQNTIFYDKALILKKLKEAHKLAKTNVIAGNITGRGFGVYICSNSGQWSYGCNFNNTRNDISSICAERSAILAAYNNMLFNCMENNDSTNFKIKYICMASNDSPDEITNSVVPCEDCLSWLNTDKYFNDDTTIFTFEKNNSKLTVRATTLKELLPYRNIILSNNYSKNKKITYSKNAKDSLEKFKLQNSDIYNLAEINYKLYQNNKFTNISNQNIVCSIISNNEIFSAKKLDWTKRWYLEPLEMCAYQAVEKFEENAKISLIVYFGDQYSQNNGICNNDGIISIKSLGRIRQKYACSETLLALNFKNEIKVITIKDYLPKKFIQGYKIK